MQFADRTVLYLEDEALVAIGTSMHLEDMGFTEVYTVYDLLQAEEVIRDGDVHVAVLDINLRGNKTSIALGERLRDEGVPVIFVSGNAAREEELTQNGFEFLAKPFEPNELGTAIATVLTSDDVEITGSMA